MKTDYLRISIIDKCNLRCMYCYPFSQDDLIPHEEILRFEEIMKVVELLSSLGLKKIKVTGGEPLMKRDVEYLIRMLKDVDGIKEVSMTTNGILLGEKYDGLIRSGLDRINISLNTLNRERYKDITGYDSFDVVLGIVERISREADFPLKLNTILFKGINDDEIIDLVDFAIQHDICIRFIEYYSTNNKMTDLEDKRVSTQEIIKVIKKKFGSLEHSYRFPNNGPAEMFSIKGSKGAVGFISSHTGNFCSSCNRLRLSSDGKLFPCLFSEVHLDIKKLLRDNVSQDYFREELSRLIAGKCDHSKNNRKERNFSLRSIGG